MRTLLLAGVLAMTGALPSPAPAAEQIGLKPAAGPKLTKAERIEKLKASVANDEVRLKRLTDEYIQTQAKADSRPDRKRAWLLRDREASRARLPASRTELAWLEGRLTLAAAESAVKSREADLAKAKPDDPGRAGIETALAEARRELEQVKRLEAEKDF